MYEKSTFQVQIVVFTPLVNGVSKMALVELTNKGMNLVDGSRV